MNKTEKKREREKKTVSEMIALYCRKNHGTKGPRMIFHHPVMALRHVIESKREKRRLERENGNSYNRNG